MVMESKRFEYSEFLSELTSSSVDILNEGFPNKVMLPSISWKFRRFLICSDILGNLKFVNILIESLSILLFKLLLEMRYAEAHIHSVKRAPPPINKLTLLVPKN